MFHGSSGNRVGRGNGRVASAPGESRRFAVHIRTHPGSAPTVKQHLVAIRALCDWLVVHRVLPGGVEEAKAPLF